MQERWSADMDQVWIAVPKSYALFGNVEVPLWLTIFKGRHTTEHTMS